MSLQYISSALKIATFVLLAVCQDPQEKSSVEEETNALGNDALCSLTGECNDESKKKGWFPYFSLLYKIFSWISTLIEGNRTIVWALGTTKLIAVIIWTFFKSKRTNSHPEWGEEGPPDFCNDMECPKFEVKIKSEDYEERVYPGYIWVTTTDEGKVDDRVSRSFNYWRVKGYFSGENEDKKTLDTTTPVLRKIEPGTNKTVKSTMMFFVPHKYQGNPPQPTTEGIVLQKSSTLTVYVRSYSGFSSWKKIQKNLGELEKALLRDGLLKNTYKRKELAYAAVYDSAWKLFNRHNEVWIVKKLEEISGKED